MNEPHFLLVAPLLAFVHQEAGASVSGVRFARERLTITRVEKFNTAVQKTRRFERLEVLDFADRRQQFSNVQ